MGDRAQGLFLVGPTAVGKTAVAHVLAERLGLRVLSVDAMQVYRGMDIGTAKPSAGERVRYRYLGLDLADPDCACSVADYLAAVRGSLVASDTAIVAGGSGLYVRCLIQGLRDAPAADPAWRAEADALLAAGGIEALQARARERAPGAVEKLADPRNPRRVIRVVELAAAGECGEVWRDQGPVLVGLSMPMDALRRRISARTEQMFRDGLLAEAARIRDSYPALSDTARQAIGYLEAWACLDGRLAEAQAVEATALRTARLAKKQMTWFRNQHRMEWIEVGESESAAAIATRVEAAWEQHGRISLHGAA